MESENGEVYEGGASREHVPLKLICSAMMILLLAMFASIELFLVRHQVYFGNGNVKRDSCRHCHAEIPSAKPLGPSEDTHKT